MTNETIYMIEKMNIDAVQLDERRRIVEDFSIEVSQAEITGLVGETGAGKSMSMMASVGLLARGLEVCSGQVTFNKNTVSGKNQALLRSNLANGVSLLFQNAKGALNPYMRAKTQIERVLKLHHVPADQLHQKTSELLTSVGLDPAEIGPKYPHEISGGQAQRVAIACSLATEPRLLIADEPTTALDVTTERAVITLLRNICRIRNMGLILIAHNLALVSESCDKIYVLHAGHVVESGSVDEVFTNPLHPYTKGLLSTIPDVDELKELIPLQGSVWGGLSITNRCRYAHRCPYATEQCIAKIPDIIQIGDHMVRCILYQ